MKKSLSSIKIDEHIFVLKPRGKNPNYLTQWQLSSGNGLQSHFLESHFLGSKFSLHIRIQWPQKQTGSIRMSSLNPFCSSKNLDPDVKGLNGFLSSDSAILKTYKWTLSVHFCVFYRLSKKVLKEYLALAWITVRLERRFSIP